MAGDRTAAVRCGAQRRAGGRASPAGLAVVLLAALPALAADSGERPSEPAEPGGRPPVASSIDDAILRAVSQSDHCLFCVTDVEWRAGGGLDLGARQHQHHGLSILGVDDDLAVVQGTADLVGAGRADGHDCPLHSGAGPDNANRVPLQADGGRVHVADTRLKIVRVIFNR